MKILILEDELTARLLLQKMMSDFGEVDAVVNGREAVDMFEESAQNGYLYDMVCLDIMVPEMDGHEVLRRIRTIEEEYELDSLDKRAKVVMITALNDQGNFMSAFHEQCEGYIFKPFSKEKIVKTMKQLGLIE